MSSEREKVAAHWIGRFEDTLRDELSRPDQESTNRKAIISGIRSQIDDLRRQAAEGRA